MLATADPDTGVHLETRHVRLFVHDDDLPGLVTPGRNLIVPDDDPKDPLHWRWVTDLDNRETLAERRDRYLGDTRPIDMKGFAAATLRSYGYIKDMKYEADALRGIVRANQHPAQVEQAEKDLLKAIPERRFRGGQSDMWYVRDAIDFGRRTKRLNEWYEHERLKQPGRPKGSKTRNRAQ